MELRQAAETAKDLVREAAALAARLQGSVTARDKGGGRGPVTEADLAVEEMLLAGLHGAFPETPIDGTREYARGLPEWAVQVGLIRAGVPVAGALALPGIGATYWGWQGGGCYLDGDPVRLERFEELTEATVIHSRVHGGAKLERVLERLGVKRRIEAGGVGYKAAQVLQGHAHLYLHAGGGTTWWDTVAPAALILAAGGVVANAAGTPLRYADDLRHRRGLLFAAPGVGEQAAAKLAE